VIIPQGVGYQDMGGRVTRYPMRASEKTDADKQRDVQLTHRWMDAMSVDYACLFPTGMLSIGMHPQKEVEADLCWAYNRWLTEKVLPEGGGRIYSMLCLPFSDPDETLRHVEEFGHRKHVTGFMVTTVRNLPVHDNAYMKTYALLEEMGKPISFHAAYSWDDRALATTNRFISVHSLGFMWFNMVHMTNWVINGIPERFPDVRIAFLEAGCGWAPYWMERMDDEYAKRAPEAPALKKKPSEYCRSGNIYFSCEADEWLLPQAVKLIGDNQIVYASDFPHWDHSWPASIDEIRERGDLNDTQKQKILADNARRLYKL